METGSYSGLFEPIKIGKVEIKNRIAMAAMGVSGLVTPDGAFAQRAIDYYLERAIGGKTRLREAARMPSPAYPRIRPFSSVRHPS